MLYSRLFLVRARYSNAVNTSLESWPKITDDLRNYSVLLLYPDPQSLKQSPLGARVSLYDVYICILVLRFP